MKQWLTNAYVWLMAIVIIMIVMVMVAVCFYLHKPIKRVVVVGRFNHLQPQCLQPILQAQSFKRFTNHNAQLLQAQAACPWLKDWRWKFSFKPVLMIYLTENQPKFIWNQSAYINQDHQIFAIKPDKQVGQAEPLVTLAGDASQLTDILNLYDQANTLLTNQQFTIHSVVDTATDGYQIELDNKVVLKLSQQQPLKELQRFVKVDAALFNKPHKKIKSIDLRYPHGFAVQWQK